MKGVHFYRERARYRTVVAVLVANGQNHRGSYDAIGGVYTRPDSPPAGTTVSPQYLKERCRRIPETEARRVHPALFTMLDKELACPPTPS